MKISFEGLPGTKKREIFSLLKKDLKIELKESDDPDWHQLFLTDSKKFSLAYELNRLITFYHLYDDNSTPYYSSLYALKKVYVDYLMHSNILTKYEYDLFMKYYRLLYQKPDIIIYFYDTFENSFRRAVEGGQEKKTHIYTEEEFKQLYYKYECIFDNNNCNIPIFKVNIDEDLDIILKNLEEILIRCQEELN